MVNGDPQFECMHDGRDRETDERTDTKPMQVRLAYNINTPSRFTYATHTDEQSVRVRRGTRATPLLVLADLACISCGLHWMRPANARTQFTGPLGTACMYTVHVLALLLVLPVPVARA